MNQWRKICSCLACFSARKTGCAHLSFGGCVIRQQPEQENLYTKMRMGCTLCPGAAENRSFWAHGSLVNQARNSLRKYHDLTSRTSWNMLRYELAKRWWRMNEISQLFHFFKLWSLHRSFCSHFRFLWTFRSVLNLGWIKGKVLADFHRRNKNSLGNGKYLQSDSVAETYVLNEI